MAIDEQMMNQPLFFRPSPGIDQPDNRIRRWDLFDDVKPRHTESYEGYIDYFLRALEGASVRAFIQPRANSTVSL